jgi:hypothetical protein
MVIKGGENMRDCKHCKNRKWHSCGMEDYCIDYEMSTDTEATARECQGFELEEVNEEDEGYRPSATNGDYSPSCPWNAPGMSISDFI